MTRSGLRAWTVVHKWTSLVCTAFMLMLCVTGLPILFHHEIDELLEDGAPLAVMAADAPRQSLDALLRIALGDQPGHVALFISFDEDRPVANITTGPRPDARVEEMTIRAFDLRTGELVGAIEQDGVMNWLVQLHTDIFLGLPGMIFLGGMGTLFIIAIVSGVVLYAPFMRKQAFGTLRVSRSRRVKWLDYHNLLGIVAAAWMSVVGSTGVIHSLATPIVAQWRTVALADLVAPYRNQRVPTGDRLASLDDAVKLALAAAPGRRVQFVAFPGGTYSTFHHYAVFMQGDTPLTKQLLTPALIDARTVALSAIRPMPWYVSALQLARPLHFGNYGGLPLKILWAVLDLLTIGILGSGLYLWRARRRAVPADRASSAIPRPAPAE